eukprot:3147909-Rhodomonas_salina.3
MSYGASGTDLAYHPTRRALYCTQVHVQLRFLPSPPTNVPPRKRKTNSQTNSQVLSSSTTTRLLSTQLLLLGTQLLSRYLACSQVPDPPHITYDLACSQRTCQLLAMLHPLCFCAKNQAALPPQPTSQPTNS